MPYGVTLTGQRGWYDTNIIWQSSDSIFSDPDLQSLYKKSELVLACVRELENAAAEAPIQLGRYNDSGDWETVKDDKFNKLFYENDIFSYADIIKLTVARLSLTGAAFAILHEYLNQEGIGGFVPVPTQTITPVFNGPMIEYYKFNRGTGQETKFENNKVASVMYHDPSCWNGYISPLTAAANRCVIDEEQANLTGEVLRNRNVPDVYESENSTNKKQIDEFLDSIKAQSGAEGENRGNSVLLPKGIRRGNQAKIDDIDFSALSGLNESRICMVYQIPPILIGAKVGLDRATYSNYIHARRSFYMETVSALWTTIASSWTKDILRKHGEKQLEIRFDTSNVKALQEDRNDIAERSVKLFQGGISDRDESRTMVGLDVDEPDESEDTSVTPVENTADELTEEQVLNGAQITAATNIVMQVAQNMLPRDSALGQLQVMFNLSQDQADSMLGSVGKGFSVSAGMEEQAKAESFLSLYKPA